MLQKRSFRIKTSGGWSVHKSGEKAREAPSRLPRTSARGAFERTQKKKAASAEKQMELTIKLGSHANRLWTFLCLHEGDLGGGPKKTNLRQGWGFKMFFDCAANAATSRWFPGFRKYSRKTSADDRPLSLSVTSRRFAYRGGKK